MRHSGRRTQAFTLLELLVVLAIGSIILTICIGMTVQAQRFWVSHQARLGAERAAWQCVNSIARDVRMATAGEQVAGSDAKAILADSLPEVTLNYVKAETIQDVSVDEDSLSLSTARIAGARGRSVPGRVRYSIKRDEDGRILGLLRQTTPHGANWEAGWETILSARVVSLDFQYLDASGAWQNEWNNTEEMPRAVRITVAAIPERMSGMADIEQFTTVVTLAGNARIPG